VFSTRPSVAAAGLDFAELEEAAGEEPEAAAAAPAAVSVRDVVRRQPPLA